MSDLISRKAAIDRIKRQMERPDSVGQWAHNDKIAKVCYRIVIEILERLPSAEPETHDNARKTHVCDNERTETHACDLIARRAAIEAIDAVNWFHPGANGKMFYGASNQGEAWFRANDIYDVIEKLPSTEPERAQFGPDCHLVWQYCTDPNDVMKAVMEKDENWEGLYSPEQIISIVYDSNHKSYVVFWIAKW